MCLEFVTWQLRRWLNTRCTNKNLQWIYKLCCCLEVEDAQKCTLKILKKKYQEMWENAVKKVRGGPWTLANTGSLARFCSTALAKSWKKFLGLPLTKSWIRYWLHKSGVWRKIHKIILIIVPGDFISKYYFPVFVPLGVTGNILSFLVSTFALREMDDMGKTLHEKISPFDIWYSGCLSTVWRFERTRIYHFYWKIMVRGF